jgi:hypothetical protein
MPIAPVGVVAAQLNRLTGASAALFMVIGS